MVKWNQIQLLPNTTELKLIELDEARRAFFNNIKHHFVMYLTTKSSTYILFELKQNLTNDNDVYLQKNFHNNCKLNARQMAPNDQYSMKNLQPNDIIDSYYYNRIFYLTHLINLKKSISWQYPEKMKIICQTFRFYYECDFGFQDEFPTNFLVK